jgi:hypothetical protein
MIRQDRAVIEFRPSAIGGLEHATLFVHRIFTFLLVERARAHTATPWTSSLVNSGETPIKNKLVERTI